MALKVGLQFLPPFLFAGMTFAIASILLLLLVPLLHVRIPRDRSSWAVMVLLGVSQGTLYQGLAFWGVQYISSGLAAVLGATLPFFVVIFAQVLTKDEPVTRMKILGIVAAFTGVAVIFSRDLAHGSMMQMSFLGSLALVASAASGGLGSVVAKKYASRIDTATLVLGQSIVGAVTLSVFGIITENGAVLEFTASVIVAVVYLGVVAALSFIGYYWLFTKTTATNGSLILFVQPVVALLLGWLILREELAPVVAIGTVLILSGVYVTARRSPAMTPS